MQVDLGTNLLVAVIIGLAGYVIGRIIELDLNRIIAAISFLSIVVPLLIFMLVAFANPSESQNITNAMLTFFVANLPGIIVGDLAAAIVAAITGHR